MLGIMTAAGKGTRLKGHFGDNIPKAFVPLNNKPLVEYGIISMRKMGVKDIYIVALEEHKSLFEGLKEKYDDINVVYMKESNHVMDSLDTVAKFALSHSIPDDERIVYWLADNVIIGDHYVDEIKLLAKEMENDKEGTGLLLITNDHPENFITLMSDGSFQDKPLKPETNTIAIGVFVHNKKALMATDFREFGKGSASNEYTIWDSWMKKHKIYYTKIMDEWFDVGNIESHKAASEALIKKQD